MPRCRREIAPNAIVHVITRLIDFQINSAIIRDEFLHRLGIAVARTDWDWLAYAAMQNHCHTVFLSGHDPSHRISRSLHTGFALWLNRRNSRHGPVMQERPNIKIADHADAGRVIAYAHNNPVKAGLARHAIDSEWTSHAAYLSAKAVPEQLKVDLGLQLSGFERTKSGRTQFDMFTNARALAPEDRPLEDCDLRGPRTRARRAAGLPAELSSPRLRGLELEYGVSASVHSPGRMHQIDDPLQVIRIVAEYTRVTPLEMKSRTQRRSITSARRIALLAWQLSGRHGVVMSGALGLAASTASYLRASHSPEELEVLEKVVRRLTAEC